MPNYLRDLGFVDGVKIARDMPSFLSQDRPKAVKKIYRALKREHPRMPAEMKARIAARQGRPGKQKQGPPYSGPITKSAGLVPKKALVAAGALAVPYAVGKKVQNRQQEQVMNKSAAFEVGVADSIFKVGYYKSQEDIVEEEANRWRQRARERGEQGAMSQYKNRGMAGGAAVGGVGGAISGALAGASRFGGKGALIGSGIGAVSGGVLGGLLGRLAGGATGKGEKRLASKLDSMSKSEREKYISSLVRDRIHQQQMANEIAAASVGRTNVNVYR